MINVALIGAGGMGCVHLRCYRNHPNARIVAICDVSEPRLRDAGVIALSRDPANPDPMSLDGIAVYDRYEDLLARGDVRLVDICLPTPLHVDAAIAALQAGKDVFCEKPLAMTAEDCRRIASAWRLSGRQFTVGHSLRYMSQYTQAHQIIASGRYGKPLYTRFHRSGGLPVGSYNNWLVDGRQSGGAVLDLHVHDIDIAHWWLGPDHTVEARGVVRDDLPLVADSCWRYPNGLHVYLHAGWDLSGGPFRFAFSVMMEQGSVAYDSSVDKDSLRLYERGGPTIPIPFSDVSPNQLQIDDIIDALETGRPITRVTLADGVRAASVAADTLRQIREER